MKKLLVGAASELDDEPRALVLDASGINDIDATGADMLEEVLADLDDLGVLLHVSDVKGPVRDVLRRAGIWAELGDRIHASTYDAVAAITDDQVGPAVDLRSRGIDERSSVTGAAADHELAAR